MFEQVIELNSMQIRHEIEIRYDHSVRVQERQLVFSPSRCQNRGLHRWLKTADKECFASQN